MKKIVSTTKFERFLDMVLTLPCLVALVAIFFSGLGFVIFLDHRDRANKLVLETSEAITYCSVSGKMAIDMTTTIYQGKTASITHRFICANNDGQMFIIKD